MLIKRLLAFAVFFLVSSPILAIDPFIIENIRVEGLQRVDTGAVFIALPVRSGDEMNDDVSSASIQALYATGYFDDVRLLREGNDLVISVVERPTIANAEFDGNKKLKDEVIENSLSLAGLDAGSIYDPDVVENFIDELKQAYLEVGNFAAEILVSVSPIERNRVNLNFTIYEGQTALIREIRIFGNEKISDEEILDEMKLKDRKTWGILNRNNRYNREVLRADIERISTLYLNQGYINFEIESSRTFLTEDREGILIVISLTEGGQYKFGEVTVNTEDEIVSLETLENLVQVEKGDLYSFEQVNTTRTDITDEFANIGYARAQVDALPTIDDENQTVDVNYVVDPGKLTYVRSINFNGNITTADNVLRREMRLYEGGLYSAHDLRLSRARLNRLGIFSNVDVQLENVPEVDDQIDVVVDVEESLTGALLFGVGYSDSEKSSINFSLSQRNLFGTGKEIDLRTDFSKSTKTLELDYLNPYYTLDGVSRGFVVRLTETDTSDTDTTAIYDLEETALGVKYRVPIAEEAIFGLDATAQQDEIKQQSASGASDYAIKSYVARYPKLESGNLRFSYRRDTRDRAFFASSGSDFLVSAEMSLGKTNYYILRGRYARFFPIGDKYTLRLSSELAYGSSKLPFYRNFYTIGNSAIRGFDSGLLGAKEVCRTELKTDSELDTYKTPANSINSEKTEITDTNGNLYAIKGDNTEKNLWYRKCPGSRSLGGNLRFISRAELYLPFFGTEDTDDKRISLFVDAGNTFLKSKGAEKTIRSRLGASEDFSFSNLRISTGIAFEWLSPIGPFGIHFATPVRKKAGDSLDQFQITLGSFLD